MVTVLSEPTDVEMSDWRRSAYRLLLSAALFPILILVTYRVAE